MSLDKLTAPLKSSEELAVQLKMILRLARLHLGVERGCMMITRSGHENLFHDGDESLREKFPFSKNVVGEVMAFGMGLVSFKSPEADMQDTKSMELHGVRVALCAPILGRGDRDFGIIYFDSRVSDEPFDKEKLELIQDLGRVIGKALS